MTSSTAGKMPFFTNDFSIGRRGKLGILRSWDSSMLPKDRIYENSYVRRSRVDSRGIARVLKEMKGDAAVLEAPNCRQAKQLIAEHPDIGLILLDLNLPDRDGFSVLPELREHYPAMAVVVLSGQQDRSSVVKAADRLVAPPLHHEREHIELRPVRPRSEGEMRRRSAAGGFAPGCESDVSS
jgi:CheY-like chemotaxis protein